MQTSESFGLYLVMTAPVVGYEACAAAAVACGVRYLQLREKQASPEQVLAMARRVAAITRGSDTLLIINDSVAIAREVDADGVHLGQDDMALAAARQLWPVPGKRFGLSTHNAEQARLAGAQAPDYIGVGPVFPTPTKAVPDPVVGLARLAEIVRATPLTTVAIGGINTENLPQVLACGVRNFAVVRAVNHSPDPATVIRKLQAIWQAAP